MCNFKTYSSFRGRKAEESPNWLSQTVLLELNKRGDSSQARNDRKIIPRTLAPPGRAIVPRTLAPPGRAIVPRTLAPPCSKVYNVNYKHADMEAPYPALTGEVSAFGGAANIVPTSFKAAKPPDSRSELYGFPHRGETGAQRSPACSLPARQYPTQEIAAGYALAMTDFKCIAKRASPQLWNDRTIPPGAYPPRREESPSG